MKDKKLRKFLGIIDYGGLSIPITINHECPGILRYWFNRIESLENYLGIKYESAPSSIGFPKHVKKSKQLNAVGKATNCRMQK